VRGEADFRWPGSGLSRCELAEGAVRPGCVAVQEIFGQYLAQVTFVNDQQPVEELPARGADDSLADRIAPGACSGLASILMPSAVNTASKEPVNCPARSLIRNLIEVARVPRYIRRRRATCVVHAPSGLAVMRPGERGGCRAR
jgi:hypothetical protein